MAKAAQQITLARSRDIPFDKLILSQANVRKVKVLLRHGAPANVGCKRRETRAVICLLILPANSRSEVAASVTRPRQQT